MRKGKGSSVNLWAVCNGTLTGFKDADCIGDVERAQEAVDMFDVDIDGVRRYTELICGLRACLPGHQDRYYLYLPGG